MNRNGKVSKKVELEIDVVWRIKKVANEKKISFDDAVIFLLERVLSPSKKACA